MAHSYNYAILQLVPFAFREEVINVGIVIFRPDSVDVRVSASPQLSSYFGISTSALDRVATSIASRDEPNAILMERVRAIPSLTGIKLSEVGWFLAENGAQYEARISSILAEYVEKPVVAKVRKKNTSVSRELRRLFKSYGLYGRKVEDLDRHKVVSNMPVGPSGKLHVDFLLKNSFYHATETMELRNIQDIGVSELKNAALVNVTFQHAREFFGERTRCYLVFSAGPMVEKAMKPALEIAQRDVTDSFNLESTDDKNVYLDIILSAVGTNGLPN